ncbi:MAG: HEAT repeat domain-containing protein [Cyanobacteria bacterium J06626_14]
MTQDELFERLKHPNPNLRERAIWELTEVCDETTVPRLMGNLGEQDVVYRRASVKALGAIGADTVPPLSDALLNSDDVTVRGSAAKALAQVALNYPEDPFPEEGLNALKAALQDANPVVHVASVMALGEIGPSAFDILVGALKTTDNVALAVSITNAMASIGDERSREVLQSLIDDESTDDYVRETAVSALSRLDFVAKNQPSTT